jgi:hypothetical protein
VRRRSACLLIAATAASAFSRLTIAQSYPSDAVADRVASRRFPSIFQAWNPADNLLDEPTLATAARHDLLWNVPEFFGLQWNRTPRLLSDSLVEDSLAHARSMRSALLELNPSMVLLAEVRWHDAPASDLPDDSLWWQRDDTGRRKLGWAEGNQYLLDWHAGTFRAHVARQAASVMGSGVVDGLLLDWWSDETDDPDRLKLLQSVRQTVGPDALILVNAGSTIPLTSAPYINGLYMETTIPSNPDEVAEWQRATATLQWAERSLLTPTLNAFETWTCMATPPFLVPCTADARSCFNRMRATTTLVLTLSDGYALFADPDGLPTADHLHNWYPFWDRSLGRPLGAGVWRADGAAQREFDNGTVVYNPIDNSPIVITFEGVRRSAASGALGTTFAMDGLDGDLYLCT